MHLTSAELARQVGEEAVTEARVAALHQITAAVTSTLDLHAVLKILMEKMDIFLTLQCDPGLADEYGIQSAGTCCVPESR